MSIIKNPPSQISLGPTTNPIKNPPAVETKPTHPLNPMPTPKPTHPLNPMPNQPPVAINPILNPPVANETPKKLNLKNMLIDDFNNGRSGMTLSGHLNRSVYADISWGITRGLTVSTRMFNGAANEPRAMTKAEIKTVRSLVQKYLKGDDVSPEMRNGLERFVATLNQGLKIAVKHPSQF